MKIIVMGSVERLHDEACPTDFLLRGLVYEVSGMYVQSNQRTENINSLN